MITGECFCGGVKYAIEGALGQARCCHCSRCRKAFSGAGSAMASIDPEEFRWVQGEDLLKRYESEKGPGLAFCSNCGSTLAGLYQGQVMGITLGTLNDDPPVSIDFHLFVDSKAQWDEIGGAAPQYSEWPS